MPTNDDVFAKIMAEAMAPVKCVDCGKMFVPGWYSGYRHKEVRKSDGSIAREDAGEVCAPCMGHPETKEQS